jgi:hypothetical protein
MVAHSEFDLPERLSLALAGDTREFSVSSAGWATRFPEVSDLANLPENALFVGLSKVVHQGVKVPSLAPLACLKGLRRLEIAQRDSPGRLARTIGGSHEAGVSVRSGPRV